MDTPMDTAMALVGATIWMLAAGIPALMDGADRGVRQQEGVMVDLETLLDHSA